MTIQQKELQAVMLKGTYCSSEMSRSVAELLGLLDIQWLKKVK